MDDEEFPFTLPSAWERVRTLLGYIVVLFGAPAAIAARLYLSAANRLEILQWLAPLEAAARRLLLLEALTLPPPNMPPPPARLRDKPVAGALKEMAPPSEDTDPETWRVVFNLWPGARGGARPLAASHGVNEPSDQHSLAPNALPLARRIEALRRLAEAPERALRRMAALLAARRGEAVRFTSYKQRKGLRVSAASPLLDEVHAHLAAALAGDTS